MTVNEHLIPARKPSKFEETPTEDLYEIVGQEVFGGVSGGAWDVAVINFSLWEGGADVRHRVLSENNAARLEVNSFVVCDALSELCYRMVEAGHGWNVATYRLTSEGQMNIKFGFREDPWEMAVEENYVD